MNVYALPEPTPIEKKIQRLLSAPAAARATWKTFPNGELAVRVTGAEGADACVLGRTIPPAENVFRTLLLVDTLVRSGAASVTVVLPYFGYSRHDRPAVPGDDAAALAILAALKSAGASRVITVDVHSDIARDMTEIPVDSVPVAAPMAAALRTLGIDGCAVVAPDAGARRRAGLVAAALGRPDGAWVEKSRDPRTGKVKGLALHGDVRGDTAVLVDDMIDTGVTMREAARLLKKAGFRRIVACATHATFSAGAAKTLREAGIAEVVVTNTVEAAEARRVRGLVVADAADAMAAAVLSRR